MRMKNLTEEEKQKKNTLIKLSPEDFDKHMCKTFPQLFRDRNKPMSETCMCWGFDIGNGWYYLLYSLCEKLDHIYSKTKMLTVFDQIKTKFGSGRFYYHIDIEKCKLKKEDLELYHYLIENLISEAEEESDNICSHCGEYYNNKITLGRWVYDSCAKCVINNSEEDEKSSIEKEIKYSNDVKELTNNIKDKLYQLKSKDLNMINKNINKIIKNYSTIHK